MPIIVEEQASGTLSDAWRFCVGSGRFDLSLRHDFHESLALAHREIGFRHIRQHGLLSDPVGIYQPYSYREERHTRYAFGYVDQVIDGYLELGIRPFVELGFMPSGLASGEATVFWWGGNITPPESWHEWEALARATISHLVERYGLDEVRGWPIEVWNEPNLKEFWLNADEDAYHRLYEVTARTIKDIDAALQVGGPALAPGGDDWLPRFADFVATHDVPIDFISMHAYTSGPAEHFPFGVRQTLRPAERLLEQFEVPRKVLRGTALDGLPVHVTEFNSSYRPDNPVHDTAFNAAYLAPVVTGGGDVVDSFSYWTLCDVFEEIGVPTSLFHGGFGLLSHRQVKKPTYHLYAFMARMGADVLARGADHLVTRDPHGRVTALLWAPALVDDAGAPCSPDTHHVQMSIPLPGPAAFVLRSSVNETAGNAWAAWREMGQPLSPRPRQLDALREAAEPTRVHQQLPATSGRVELDVTLARHEISLLQITTVDDETPAWWHEAGWSQP